MELSDGGGDEIMGEVGGFRTPVMVSRRNSVLDEVKPFEKEVAHEHATTLLLKRAVGPLSGSAEGTLECPDSPDSPLSLHSMVTSGSKNENLFENVQEAIARPPPIPLNQIKDPANYISNSSRLNPENGIFTRTHDYITHSPSLSPVLRPGSMSPSLDRKGKRKRSPALVPGGGGNGPFGLGIPMMGQVGGGGVGGGGAGGGGYFGMTRARSLSASSSASNSSSMVGVVVHGPTSATGLIGQAVANHHAASVAAASGSSTGGTMGTGTGAVTFLNPHHQLVIGAGTTLMARPGSPRLGLLAAAAAGAAGTGIPGSPVRQVVMGQMLNITGAQGGLSKMSLSE
ncbi:hypothetical protein HDU67_009353 [Dinochytrium kinnereticum]|nr:hypothetical protein HDU67_009353 [Dinochytrium kinnereticum]